MENTATLDVLTVSLAVVIFLGGFVMMFTDYFTSRK